MIISASRRTDIPAYYSDWFFNRINEGFLMVRNPMNFHQVGKINLSPDKVDCIVFWTKNPIPMLDRLDELKDYMYYFQFTITPYEKDIETNLPSKDLLIQAFQKTSGKIGADRVIWRYDPILINEKYSIDYHIGIFHEMAEKLHKYTHKVIISFIDISYRGVKGNIKELAMLDFLTDTKTELASKFAEIAKRLGLTIEACAVPLDLAEYGIGSAQCIDGKLISALIGRCCDTGKDKYQRRECGCASSIDVGMYNTCKNGCLYCYANYSPKLIEGHFNRHNAKSAFISGDLSGDDIVRDRN